MSMPQSAGVSAKTFGHFTLHYRAGDGERVCDLFIALGLRVEDLGPARNGDRLFKVVIDSRGRADDGAFFVSSAARHQLDLETALATLANADAIKTYRAAGLAEPQAGSHVGVSYDALETLEEAVRAVEALAATPDFSGRVKVTRMKAKVGLDPAVDERMAASPVFRPSDREAFGDRYVQVFIHTDLVAGGPLTFGQMIELNYVFPSSSVGYASVKVYESEG
jgi:hypothetical protein